MRTKGFGLKVAVAMMLPIVPTAFPSGAAQAASPMVSNFAPGAIHITKSLDTWNDKTAVASGRASLKAATTLQTQWLMGNGAGNPEPSPGVYDWKSLDQRVNQVMAGASEIVLTAVGAPDWMKGGKAGATDWTKLDVAPLPDFYDEYADLVAAAVSRYPTIGSVQVWSEMRGFWIAAESRWDYQGYTTLYNLVYTRVKAVRPTVKVGGPYVAIASYGGANRFNSTVKGPWGTFDKNALDAIAYWMQNKVGADFIAIDGQNRNKDKIQPTDEFTTLDKFVAFGNWLRGLDPVLYPGAATLPIRWAEWYALTYNSADSDAKKNALIGAGLIRTIKSGVEGASFWGATGDKTGHYYLAALTNPNNSLTMLTDPSVPGGGMPTIMYPTIKYFHDYFAAGQTIVDDGNTNASVEVIATAVTMLAVNKTATSQSGTAMGMPYVLMPYEVKLISLVVG